MELDFFPQIIYLILIDAVRKNTSYKRKWQVMAITENTLNEKEPNQKHDEGYKAILSDKESFLYFLKEHIAEPWTANISIDDMTRVNKSFITDEYKHLDSDLIYKLRIDNSDVYFYVLVELQSQVDFTMPFRLLKYIVALLNEIFHDMDENVRARKDFKLPAIVPIILYNGDDKWTVARRFREYTKNAEIFGDSIIDFGYLLLDVKRIDKDTLSSPEKLLDAVFSFDKERFAEDATRKKSLTGGKNEPINCREMINLHCSVGWYMYYIEVLYQPK